MKKRFDCLHLSVMILGYIPISAVMFLLQKLASYENKVHNDAGFYVCVYSLLCLVVSFFVWLKARKVCDYATVIWLISVAVLAFVFYVGDKIPFCVVCDQVTAEDLGFLIHWIKPEVSH